MSVNYDIIKKFDNKTKDVFICSITICLKLLENIINNPRDEKYRKFKKSNPKISKQLLALDGMEEFLISNLGFELTNNEEFILRRGGIGHISKLKNYRDALQNELECIKNPSNNDVKLKDNQQEISVMTCDNTYYQKISFPSIIKSSNQFLRQLEQLSDFVMQYEDLNLQKAALKLIPVEKLKVKAIESLRMYQRLIKEKEILDDEPPLDEFFLEELASWFKNEFFTWVNNMACRICKEQDTRACGNIVKAGVRTEQYMCNRCRVITEFPRYNDIKKLLLTRMGRCGESANLFTFICRCFKYDARYIFCTGDHVWTEVYYYSKKRFVHIDPSENVFDSPYMYEKGWHKKLDYVIAFSCDDVQDVSWRYSNEHEEMKRRRKNCTETELVSTIVALRNKRQSNLSNSRKKFLSLRTMAELSEMMVTREATNNELKGRSSGSLAWRLERGEINTSSNKYIFEIKAAEINAKQFNIRYSSAQDYYERFIDSDIIEKIKSWRMCVFKIENIFRKVEHDHKMAYLSRTEDSDNGMIEWKFNFKTASIKSINLKFETKTFESGRIKINYLDPNGKLLKGKEDLLGLNGFSIVAFLSGGNGDCAWQHSQLFRENINNDSFSFCLSIEFI